MNQTTRYIKTLTLAAVILIVFAQAAEASSVIRSGDTVSIAGDQAIEGDFYSAGGKVNVSGSVAEDMISTGGQITLNGSVGGDAFLVGGQVDVHGTVGDDLRILSGEVTIAEPVMGDVFVMGGVVNILSTASVAGDVVLFAGEATIEGSVGGDVLGRVEILRVDAQVAGNIDVAVKQLTLGDRATIAGSVSYVSNNLVTQALNATVGGDLVRNDPVLPIAESSVTSALLPMLILLFSILVWYWISRPSLQSMVDRALIKSPRPILLGVVTLLLGPFAIGILLASMIGTVIGFIGLFSYLLIFTLGLIGLSAVIGQLLMRSFSKKASHLSLATLVVGVIAVTALTLIPVVGHLVLVGFGTLTIGSIVDIIRRPNLN